MSGVSVVKRGVDERRHFCRIDDEIILQFRPVRAEGGAAPTGAFGDQACQHFLLLSRLAEQREQVRALLRDLRSGSPKLSRCLAALDERIGLIETAVLLDQIGAYADLRQRVKLSAGGLVFRTGVHYARESVLLLEMILLPTLTGIVSRGQVLRSVRHIGRDGEPPFLTTIEFVDMKESTRDLIARHVLARQSRRLQQERA